MSGSIGGLSGGTLAPFATNAPATATTPLDTTGASGGTSGIGASGASTGSTSGTSAGSNPLTASGENMFLQLLVAQLKNQDPSAPMDSSTFVNQLAQFNSVEQMITLNQTITQELNTQQTVEGIALLGRTVTYTTTSTDGTTTTSKQGVVSSISTIAGKVQLTLADQNKTTIPLSSVIGAQ